MALILLAAGALGSVYAVAAAAWLFLRNARTSLRTAIVIAVVLRALFLFAEPKLSNDVYRYLWDGNELAHGRNPYARAPLDDPRINHREIPTIYPPHAEILFALAHNLTAWRLLLIACDVLTIILLPRRFALAYATFPPLLFEGAWSAHVEVVAGMLLLIALTKRSGSALGTAIGIKIIPIAAVPALWNRRAMKTCLPALLLPVIPFALAGPIMPGLHDYATRWIFNSPAYDVARAIVERYPLKAWWTVIKFEPVSNWVYFHVYPDFVARALLAIVAFAIIVQTRRASSGVAALLLCSPAIHPWYWIVAVPCAFVEGNALVIALALCAPFSYLLYEGVSKGIVYTLCYVIALLPLSKILSSGVAPTRAASRLRTAPDTSPS